MRRHWFSLVGMVLAVGLFDRDALAAEAGRVLWVIDGDTYQIAHAGAPKGGWLRPVTIAIGAIIALARDSAIRYHFDMNNAHRKALAAIFNRPTRADIRWSDIEALMVALGGEVSERAGSRVAVTLNGVRAIFHRPHPQPATKKGAVDAVRQFLTNAGIKP